jgi:hypothetical protein
MAPERALRVVLILAGVLFTAGIVPLVIFLSREPTLAMLMSMYAPLGICLLLAARHPEKNRSLIAFAGWANIAHAAVMGVQEFQHVIRRQEVLGVIVFGVIGVVLIALTPRQKLTERVSATGV